MAAQIRRATGDDLTQLVNLDFRNFGGTVDPGDVEVANEVLDLDRFVVAEDDGELVGAGGSFDIELTVPGGATLPMSGVTWVSVLASHRRQGLLRGLMTGLDELSAEFEEPILGLLASEGSIYERFGYGIATRCRVVEIDRRRTQVHPDLGPEPVRLIDAAEHVDELLAIYDRYRRTQPGEVSRSAAMFREQNIRRNKQEHGAIHQDGYAIWTVEPDWANGHPRHLLNLKELVAVTPEAHLALWNVVLSIDLVGTIRSHRTVAADDPLPYLLTDQRAVRTIEANDWLWLKVTDPVRCFEARRYRTDDQLVVGVVDGRHATPGEEPVERFTAGADGVKETDAAPDLVLTRSTLGPLLMGISASQLAAGRRLVASPETLERADALFGTGRLPHCRTSF